MSNARNIASGAKFVDTAGDTMTGALVGTSAGFVGDVNIGNNDASNPANKLRLGATQYGAADIAPLDEGGHKVGMAFYTDGTGDTTIDPVLRMQISNDGRVGIGTSPEEQTQLAVTSQSNFGGVYVGKVRDSANNNSEALLMHRLDGNQTGFQFSGEIYCNSWTGQAHVNFNATAYYTTDNVSWNINHSGIGGGVSKVQLKLATVSYDSKSWLAIIKDGGGTGNFYINALVSANIANNGGLRAIASSYSVTTTHVNLN